MTPEQQSELTEKRWLANAKSIRQSVTKTIAHSLGVPGADINFTNREETYTIARMFSERLYAIQVTEVPDRCSAIRLAETELLGVDGKAFLLPHGYDDCGAVDVDFATALNHLDALLRSQQEIARLILDNGSAGVCIFTQEGSSEEYPRYLQLWR